VKHNLEEILKAGGVAVIPTDTIYGIVASAGSVKGVEEVFGLKKRNPEKPVLVLVSSVGDIVSFGAELPKDKSIFLRKKTTVVLPLMPRVQKKFRYLHRGKNTLGFRIPQRKGLLRLLKKTGPLIAPSANPEGLEPARTIGEARSYFGEKVDFYLGGRVSKKASRIVALKSGKLVVLRK